LAKFVTLLDDPAPTVSPVEKSNFAPFLRHDICRNGELRSDGVANQPEPVARSNQHDKEA
jgi:hypothetical protein